LASLELRYTTQTPLSSQASPELSLGGYRSSNTVYLFAALGSSLNSTDTTINLEASPTLPANSSGLASIGPEIVSYSGVGSASLTGIVRGVSLGYSFPAEATDPENVHYLDITKLFNTGLTETNTQYRCVSVVNTSIATTLSEVEVSVIQDPDANVQIDIGIEVPKFDMYAGVNSGAASQSITDVNFIGFAQNFFKDALITVGSSSDVISSSDGDDGTFILTNGISTLTGGENFTIHPAPSQSVSNGKIAPSSNSGLFFGFSEDGNPTTIGTNSIRENTDMLRPDDVFYIWLKRTLIAGKKRSSNTGAILSVSFEGTGS